MLSAARINETPMFHVERNQTDKQMIFYRLDFFDPVDDDTFFIYGNTRSRFKDHFISIVQRTGKHIPDGIVYANWEGLPKTILNHQLVNYL